jgi:hypothetical protein
LGVDVANDGVGVFLLDDLPLALRMGWATVLAAVFFVAVFLALFFATD